MVVTGRVGVLLADREQGPGKLLNILPVRDAPPRRIVGLTMSEAPHWTEAELAWWLAVGGEGAKIWVYVCRCSNDSGWSTACVLVWRHSQGWGGVPADTLPRPPQDYSAALRGLCEDALEGLLFLLLFSLLSAGALATALCSLPRAWALFPPRSGGEGGHGPGGGRAGRTPGLLLGGEPPDGSPILLLCHSPRPPVTTMMTQMMTTLSTLRYWTHWPEGRGWGPVL